MKKLFLTLIVSIALCGYSFANTDDNPYNPDSHWPDFYYPDYETHGDLIAGIMIDGECFTIESEDWDQLEVAAFVGDDECRSNWNFLTDEYVLEYEDPYPIIMMPIFYTEPGDVVYFKMYNHRTGIEYTQCELLHYGEAMTILTGEDHTDEYMDDWENPPFLSFTTPDIPTLTFELPITGFQEENNHWYLMTTPVNNYNPADAGMIMDNEEDYDLFTFDQKEVLQWVTCKPLLNQGFTLTCGTGYLYARKTTETLEFTGNPYMGSASFPLEYEEGHLLSGWNLIGNPYGTEKYIDKSEFLVMNEDGSDFMAADYNRSLLSMEGFMVQAFGENESVTFSDTPIDPVPGRLVLNVSQGRGVIDRAIVKFGDSREMQKFSINETSTKVYVPKGNIDYSVVSSAANGEMPLNFKAQTSGTYTITVSSHNTDFSYLHLFDRIAGKDVDLLQNGSYTFTGSPRDNENRFVVKFNQYDSDNFAYQCGEEIIVSGNGTVQVFDVMGRFVTSFEVNGCSRIDASQFANAVYIFRMTGDNAKTQKLVVR